MEVVNKEQERQEMRKNPAYKKKGKTRTLLSGVGIALFLVAAFFYFRSPSTTGTPHIAQIAGMTIEPGKTTVQELADHGFELSSNTIQHSGQTYSIMNPVDGNSYYNFLSLLKNGEHYATIAVVNEASVQATLADCKVREIRVSSFHQDDQNALVDGLSMPELTIALLKQNNGEPEDSDPYPDSDGNTRIKTVWKKGRYSLELETLDDGTVQSFTAKYEWK